MAMVSHRTGSIYRRYAIADEAMLKEGAVKLTVPRIREEQDSQIVPIKKRNKETRSEKR